MKFIRVLTLKVSDTGRQGAHLQEEKIEGWVCGEEEEGDEELNR